MILLFAGAAFTLHAGRSPAPPAQAASGPGGATYLHQAVVENVYGSCGLQYRIYEPSQPQPSSAPVVAFLHGWGVLEPGVYLPWITHLVRRGNIVVYPQYQANRKTLSPQFTPNAVQALLDACARLLDGTHVAPDFTRFALVGHSAGGMIAANLAAVAARHGLPEPRALMAAEPGNSCAETVGCVPSADYSAIPAGILLLTVAGDRDTVVGTNEAQWIYSSASQVPGANKNYILLRSDTHGTPDLLASHGAPTDQPLNAFDYYAFWKWFDGLTDAAFWGLNRQYALGNTPEQRWLGSWSDGVAVVEPIVTAGP